MSPLIELAADDELVRELLAPLARVQPVTLRRTTRRHRRPHRMLLAAAALAAALLVGGLALAGVFGPLHNAVLKPNAPTLPSPVVSGIACRLIGQSAGTAQTVLTQHGYQIGWRFQHWGTQATGTDNNPTAPQAVTGGYTSTPATVPPDSIVWDITPDDRTPNMLFVFVQAPNDPNAPTISPPSCGSAGR